MRKKEEITDVMADRAYTDKDKQGKYVFYVGRILTFNYEGSPIQLRVTKIDRKNKRMWAEHITTYDLDTGMSHYGHHIDASDPNRVYCEDCKVEISQSATEAGEMAAATRDLKELNASGRKFKYSLLKTDGTIEEISEPRDRMVVQDFYPILDATLCELIPFEYYPEQYQSGYIIYGDEEARLKNKERNKHMLVLEGDTSIGEPEEWDVVGDLILEQEVR